MKVLFIVIGIIILIAAIIALRVFFGLGHPGNAAPYALRRQLPRDNSPLRGKTILCLGSSISSGFSSGGVSFLDYLARIDGCRIIQETVSATTLADRGYFSYLKRLRRRRRPIASCVSFPPMTPPSAVCRAGSAAASGRRTLMFPPLSAAWRLCWPWCGKNGTAPSSFTPPPGTITPATTSW